jgi:hypothetical protein
MNGLLHLLRRPTDETDPGGFEPVEDYGNEEEYGSPYPAGLQGGGQMSRGEQAWEAIRQVRAMLLRKSGDAREREGTLLHKHHHYQAPTVAEATEYAASRAWVPAGHENDGWSGPAGEAYRRWFATPMLRFLLTCIWITQSPVWMAWAVLIFAVTITPLIGLALWLGLL